VWWPWGSGLLREAARGSSSGERERVVVVVRLVEVGLRVEE